ncbi:MAG: fructose-1,6-bisphosphatase [Muribaculaceae bacterium]|nr:fructose-1,6-bisphosphatase [Muribaculaceae bacterium]
MEHTHIKNFNDERDLRLLELLSQTFGTVSAASTEIINLEAILNLPKGTEHFVADLHGEHAAFNHILRNASGNIKRKVTDLFGNSMRESDIRQLCSLIYYPEKKLELIRIEEPDLSDFYNITLHRLISVCQSVSSKYTRSKVRKALPPEFAYIIEELLHESPSDEDKQAYFSRIIETIISTGQADAFIVEMCRLIQRLSIDQLHILGDIFDRGPGAHLILDDLCSYSRFDIQWGNHDALWMGAAAGNDACIANVLRLSLRYANLTTLDDGYGISLLPLATFAMETYADDPATQFLPITGPESRIDQKTCQLIALMHKAIAVIQFKLEGNLISNHPEWNMENRRLLHHISADRQQIFLPEENNTFCLNDTNFPTIDPQDPYRLTSEEKSLVEKLHHSFRVSDKLRRHMKVLLSNGNLYNVCNSNLLFHASMPINHDGSFKNVFVLDGHYSGRKLYDRISHLLRAAYNDDAPAETRQYAKDYYWYLWCGPDSPLFDKSRMTTFERYFIDDKSTHIEEKGAYYTLRDRVDICEMILDEFSVSGKHRHIINGHVPVKAVKGESPIRADGRLMVIDGGFAEAYHNKTGTAGYTLVYHSTGFVLVQHEPFSSVDEVIRTGSDIAGTTVIVESSAKRIRVRDTDKGRVLANQINELKALLHAYRNGTIPERKK